MGNVAERVRQFMAGNGHCIDHRGHNPRHWMQWWDGSWYRQSACGFIDYCKEDYEYRVAVYPVSRTHVFRIMEERVWWHVECRICGYVGPEKGQWHFYSIQLATPTLNALHDY